MNERLIEENFAWIEKNIKQGLEKCRNTKDNCELEFLRILESVSIIKEDISK